MGGGEVEGRVGRNERRGASSSGEFEGRGQRAVAQLLESQSFGRRSPLSNSPLRSRFFPLAPQPRRLPSGLIPPDFSRHSLLRSDGYKREMNSVTITENRTAARAPASTTSA